MNTDINELVKTALAAGATLTINLTIMPDGQTTDDAAGGTGASASAGGEMRGLPDKPGLWRDREGDIWLVATLDGRLVPWLMRAGGAWDMPQTAWDMDDPDFARTAPFTRIHMEGDNE
ncbi:hypothetical protein [Bifidobacterium stellenboschense]|uniref:Uncharacterized protein n=1 Tax=Bifidobacterium stellenboschense TaxID=762211 RepID=A0A087DQN5_9BIFI|nr:hypothetical protein [Bifidobacterium stellenboschense]KFI97835.1 hypothetical protein BSTEL_0646 [Bifidobacterium stellenboschense]